jgi:hypothetical protein
MYDGRDQVLNAVALGFFAVAGAALLVPGRRTRPAGDPR